MGIRLLGTYEVEEMIVEAENGQPTRTSGVGFVTGRAFGGRLAWIPNAHLFAAL